jgi:dTDP-4-dehydrorhamnose reductase
MKIFITGGSGLLGQYLNIELAAKHEILTQYNTNGGNCRLFNSVKCAITDYEAVGKIFSTFNPDIVIHAAAVSNADRADKMAADEVYSVNVNAAKFIAEQCKKYNCKMIYTSTDLVYAGYRGSFIKEDAKLIPISLYAETKLMGEVKVRETFDDYIILRVALQYGFGINHSISHFQNVYNQLKEGKEVKLFSNQFRSALSLADSARMICELLDREVKGETINFGGIERVTRYDLGMYICQAAGFDKSLVKPITMEEANVLYKVEDVSMNVDKLGLLGIKAGSVKESVARMLK